MARVPNHIFDITVTYRDLANIKDQKTFTFEMGNWDNTDQFGSRHTDDVANALEEIAGKLEHMTHQRATASVTDRWSDIRQFISPQDDPQEAALERIADALERMSSSDSKNS